MSDETVTIEIDGVEREAPRGQMLIEATDAAGVFVPRFCYHRKLSVAANCRMCLVEVEKAPKPLPACATPVADGMKVSTRSELALKAQKAVMEFLLINHPLDCPICDQGGECELQDLAMGYGRDVSRFTERKRVVKDKDVGPLIQTEMTRCIHCTRCVRFGEEIAGLQELGATGRTEHMEIGTYVEKSIASELSGNVIDLCPVGALTDKVYRFSARAWEMQQRASVAPHDCVGSSVDVHSLRHQVRRVVPRANDAVNEVWISDRDRYSRAGLRAPDRLEAPAVKRDGRWETVDWEVALGRAAAGLREAVARHGADQLGALVSPSATLEEHFLAQKLVRGLGSGNVDHRLRQTDFSDQEAAPAHVGLGMPIAALEALEAVLLVGSNPRKDQPLVNHRLRKAALGGAAVYALNPVDWVFNYPLAGRFVATPTGMVRALAGIAAALAADASGAVDVRAADEDPIPALVAEVEPDAAQRAAAARLRAASRAAVLLGPLALEHPQASTLRALAGFVAARSGATLGFLTEGANSAGAWVAGAVPHRLAGAVPRADAGLDAAEMLSGGLEAYLLLGVEPEHDSADPAAARARLEDAGLVVSLTGWRTPAMESYADVLLPLAPFAENEGTFVNAEGRWQSFEPAVKPFGQARPAWKILRVLGNLLELDGFEHMACAEVREEVRDLAPGRAPQAPDNLTWRVAPDALPDDAAGELERIGYVPAYAVDPLVRRSAPLQATPDAHDSDARLRVAPALADRLGLAPGDRARVRQGESAVTLAVVVDTRVPDGAALVHAGVAGSDRLGPAFGTVAIEKDDAPPDGADEGAGDDAASEGEGERT